MNSSTSDFTQLKKTVRSLGPKHLLGLLIVVAILMGLQHLSKLSLDNVDRTDYKLVADQYIRKNAVIAKMLGKVSSVSHIGVGGEAGSVSYNTFSIRGADALGVCYCTLERNANGSWYVAEATLTTGGHEYSLPVKRTGKVPFQGFRLIYPVVSVFLLLGHDSCCVRNVFFLHCIK